MAKKPGPRLKRVVVYLYPKHHREMQRLLKKHRTASESDTFSEWVRSQMTAEFDYQARFNNEGTP